MECLIQTKSSQIVITRKKKCKMDHVAWCVNRRTNMNTTGIRTYHSKFIGGDVSITVQIKFAESSLAAQAPPFRVQLSHLMYVESCRNKLFEVDKAIRVAVDLPYKIRSVEVMSTACCEIKGGPKRSLSKLTAWMISRTRGPFNLQGRSFARAYWNIQRSSAPSSTSAKLSHIKRTLNLTCRISSMLIDPLLSTSIASNWSFRSASSSSLTVLAKAWKAMEQ